MQGTWRKARNGWLVVDEHGDEWVAENTLALLPIFEGMSKEDDLLSGDPSAPAPLGLLSSMKGAALAIIRPGGERDGPVPPDETWMTDEEMDHAGDPDWPSTLPGSGPSTSADVAKEEQAAGAAADEVAYVPAAEDGYEFPAVRGPLNGRREIQCPTHGWQTAVVKDGAYRCQFKPSPRQTCQEPGTPKAEAEKRLVAS